MQVKLCLLGTIQAPDKYHQLLSLHDFPCTALWSPYQPLRSYCVSLLPGSIPWFRQGFSHLFLPLRASRWMYCCVPICFLSWSFLQKGSVSFIFFPKLGYSCLTILLVSAVQCSESATYIYMYTSPHSWVSLPSLHPTHLGHPRALGFLCYTAGSH